MNSKFIRRTLSILIVVLILSTALTPIGLASSWREPPPNNPFQDVSPGTWFHDSVTWAWVNGIVEGPSSTRFNPNANITRAEFVTLLWRVAGSPAVAPSRHFRDVPTNAWFAPAVEWARLNPRQDEPITTGSPARSNTFRPNANISRQEMVTMLRRAHDPAGPTLGALGSYGDGIQVATFARPAVQWAIYRGIMGVNTNRLNPRSNASRAEAVTMIRRAIESIPGGVAVPELPPSPSRNLAVGVPQPNIYTSGVSSVVQSFGEGETVVFNTPFVKDGGLTPTHTGVHRFELRTLATAAVADLLVFRGTNIVANHVRLRQGESHNLHLTADYNYTVQIIGVAGQLPGTFEMDVRFPKPPVNITNRTEVRDNFEFPGQENVYILDVPPGGGFYRFEIPWLPFRPGESISVNLQVNRGNQIVLHPTPFRILEGITLELEEGRYTIRATPGAGTLPLDYRISIASQGAGHGDIVINPRGTTRGDVLINDRFNFTGQQNRYMFTPRYAGSHNIVFSTLPTNGQVVVEIFGHDAFHRSFFVSNTWVVSNVTLRAGLQYEIRVLHLGGNVDAYSFLLTNP